ncbi:MAG: Mur ligase family protein, partial [Bacteroidota bacterium]
MKRSLKELFEQTSWLDWKGKDVEVASIQFDSRKIKSGDVFVAVPGTQVDGHMFIDKAIEQGATGVILERYPEKMKEGVTYVKVTNSAEVLSHIASAYYDHPSRQIKLVGVTGTNGKTTTVTLLYDLFQGLGYKCGLLSTVENKIDREVRAASHTTPDAVAVNQLLADIVDAQCDYAFMEVSSHAVDQKRTSGLYFSGGVFTNMSHDHLD